MKHGISKPYGGRLITNFEIVGNMIKFPPSPLLSPSQYYPVDFPEPEVNDFIVETAGPKSIVSQSLITHINKSFNMSVIECATPLKQDPFGKLSFYKSSEYKSDVCSHSSDIEGIYMKFFENPGRKSEHGIYHQIINPKQIAEINLKLSVNTKTYKLT